MFAEEEIHKLDFIFGKIFLPLIPRFPLQAMKSEAEPWWISSYGSSAKVFQGDF